MRQITVRLICVLILTGLLSGCSKKEPGGQSISGFAFNTTYTITLYEGGSQELLDSCISVCSDYEMIYSRTQEGSELYRINYLEELYEEIAEEEKESSQKAKWYEQEIRKRWDTKGDIPQFSIENGGALSVTLSENLSGLIEKGLFYSRLSKGLFDITICPVSSLWDFTGENPKVPEQKELDAALTKVDYRKLKLDKTTLTFEIPGMELDLGGIAKGYIADALKQYLEKDGVSSGLVDLGGNIVCIGGKPDGEKFHIGIQQPFADRNETIAAVNVQDLSIVSSGVYERYFKTEDGTLYHHILSPKTGYSYENDLIGVTILSEQSVDGDGLSTSCFAMGLEKGMELIDSFDGMEAVFITSDEKMHYSNGYEELLLD